MAIYGYLKKKFPSNFTYGWYCNGHYINGCRGGKDYGNSDLNEVRYHCSLCNFDYCNACYEYYGNEGHEHPVEKLT